MTTWSAAVRAASLALGLGVRGLGVGRGFGIGVWGLEIGFWDFGIEVWGLGWMVCGLWFGLSTRLEPRGYVGGLAICRRGPSAIRYTKSDPN